MRSFKFRIYDKVRKEWLHKGIDLFGEIILFGMHTVRPDGSNVSLSDLNNLVAMQYTGLKDKDGIDIYEGDLIESKSHSPAIMLVEFIEGGFAAKWGVDYPIDINHFYPSSGCLIKVIGNIFDDRHLMNDNLKKHALYKI